MTKFEKAIKEIEGRIETYKKWALAAAENGLEHTRDANELVATQMAALLYTIQGFEDDEEQELFDKLGVAIIPKPNFSEQEMLDSINGKSFPITTQELDEAAKIDIEEARRFVQEFRDNPTESYFVAAIEYFFNRGKEAGAKWMAEQGDIVETEPYYCSEEGDCEVSACTSFQPGDKVIVQIRKK